jgi:hypothetical protein
MLRRFFNAEHLSGYHGRDPEVLGPGPALLLFGAAELKSIANIANA